MDAYLPGATTYVCAAIEISAFPAEQARGGLWPRTDRRGRRLMLDDGHQNPSAPLSIAITSSAYAVWVAISGELDSSNHDQLKQAPRRLEPRRSQAGSPATLGPEVL
jgi:hypothetical protein